MTAQHWFLAPSGAGCTVHCAAAPSLQAKYPEDAEHPTAREGTAMHWAAAEYLHGRPVPIGAIAPNGITLDYALLEAAGVYTDDVLDVLGRHPGELHIEEPLHNDALHPTDNGGTPDAWIIQRTGERIYIPLWDFKGGHGLVEVFECWQLINYAALILRSLAVDGYQEQHIIFNFRIVQPRAYHPEGVIRTWSVCAADLRAHFNRLTSAYAAAMLPGVTPPATPGTHCKRSHCSAAGRGCSALMFASWDVVDYAYESRGHDLQPLALGLTLREMERAQDMLDAQVEGMRTQALMMIQRGKDVPYYTTEQGAGREVIPKEKIREFIIIGEALGINVAKEPECLTPKQARDAGMPPDVVANYAFQRTGERKLVQDNGAKARKTFG